MNPSEPVHDGASQTNEARGQVKSQGKRGVVGGFVLIALGVLFLADNLLPDFRLGDYWPVILVAIGVGLLWKANRTS